MAEKCCVDTNMCNLYAQDLAMLSRPLPYMEEAFVTKLRSAFENRKNEIVLFPQNVGQPCS